MKFDFNLQMFNNTFATQASAAGGFVVSVKDDVTTTAVGYMKDLEWSDGAAYRTTTVMGRQVALQGEKEIENAEPYININAMQIEASLMALLFQGYQVADNAGIKTLTRNIAVVESDYHDEVIITGKLKNGKDLTITGKLALAVGPNTIIIPESGDVILPVRFEFHNADQTVTTFPIEIIIDETV